MTERNKEKMIHTHLDLRTLPLQMTHLTKKLNCNDCNLKHRILCQFIIEAYHILRGK